MNDHEQPRIPEPESPPLPPAPTPPPERPRRTASPEPKIPGVAALLSAIPGLPIGQLYADAFDRAIMVTAAFWLLIVAAVQGVLPVTLVVFACIFVWIYTMFDAYRQAQLTNLGGAEIEIPARPAGGGRLIFGVFLAVAGGLLLVENLGWFDLYWLSDWWPAFVFLIGVYLIFGAVKERLSRNE